MVKRYKVWEGLYRYDYIVAKWGIEDVGGGLFWIVFWKNCDA